MGDLGVNVNEEQEADELADEGGDDGNQHLGWWPGKIFRQPKNPIFYASRLNHGLGITRGYTNAKNREERAIYAAYMVVIFTDTQKSALLRTIWLRYCLRRRLYPH